MVDKRALTSISKHLIKRSETVAISESVTAGLIANHFSLAKNATSFFQGGLIAYNLGQKARHLDVDPIHGELKNCVSEKVAQQMALNVAKLFIATTCLDTKLKGQYQVQAFYASKIIEAFNDQFS